MVKLETTSHVDLCTARPLFLHLNISAKFWIQ